MRTSRCLGRLTVTLLVFCVFFQSVMPAEDEEEGGSGGFDDDDDNSFGRGDDDDDDTEGSGTTVASKGAVTEPPARRHVTNRLDGSRVAVTSAPSSTSRMEFSNNPSQGFFDKMEVLAAVIAGGVVGVVLAVLLVVLLVHRLKKKDAGSYALEQSKSFQAGYQKAPTQEIYA